MKNNQNILPFVEAFYQLAKEQKNLNKTILLIKETLQAVLDTDFVDFLSDYNLDLESKKKVLDKIYKKEQLFINWILVLIENKIVRKFDFILKKFIQIYNSENKIVEGYIYFAHKKNLKDLTKITNVISKKWAKKVYLDAKIDAELIGGVKLIINDNVWDNSILKKLNDLTEELINKKGLITLDGEY